MPERLQPSNRNTLSSPEVCREPLAQLGIEDFGDSSINIGLRYRVPTKKYFQVKFQVNSALHKALLAGEEAWNLLRDAVIYFKEC